MSALVTGRSYEIMNTEQPSLNGLQIIRHPSYPPCPKSSAIWFDLRVFYVRVSNFVVDDTTTEFLTLNLIPLNPHTLLEVNGSRCSLHSDGITSILKRDRMDKKSEEATFIGTDSIRLTGSVKFEVFDKDNLVLSGTLEMSNGSTGESKESEKMWIMNCDSEMSDGTGFLKGKHSLGSDFPSPSIEVYVTGCFSGTPIILTKTLQLIHRKKHYRKGMLDAIPEDVNETNEHPKGIPSTCDWQMADSENSKPENEADYMYWMRTECIEGEDGDFSWFNAGVRVGVGISLGVCVGLGIGVGLLVRSYHATTRNFKRRLI